ncbi:MAG TPA: SCO family protein [Terriglobales bacterium]|nr:SCO family protein [Terriglobales bacterium]
MSSNRKKFGWPLVLIMFCVSAAAQNMNTGMLSPPANVRPPGLKNVGIQQNLNQQIPPGLEFRDESGRAVHLSDYFGRKPMILNLVYYNCPMLCSEVLSGLETALKPLKFDVGKEFEILTISFDPRETPEDAAKKKAEYLKRYGRAGAAEGWHFLTGPKESVDALTKAAGFQYEYDAKTGQFAHTTAIMILTPEGKISQYYYGVEFAPKDLRLGLVQASNEKIGNVVDEVLLYCYHYDPQAGKYSATVFRIMRLAGVATMLAIGTLMAVLLRRGSGPSAREVERTT